MAFPPKQEVPGISQRSEKLQNLKRAKDSEAENPRSRDRKSSLLWEQKGCFSVQPRERFLLEKRWRDWCRRDKREGVEVWGGLDPPKDPQPPLKVTETSEGSQRQGKRWGQKSRRRHRGMSEAKGPRGHGTVSEAEEHPVPAAWCLAASRTGWNTGWCLKNKVEGLRTIPYLKWTQVLIPVFVCHFGWGQHLRALLQHCYSQPITKKKQPRI